MNLFRRLPTSRLIVLCAAVVALGLAIVAVAGAVGSDPKPPPAKPLAEAIHDTLDAPAVQGVTARVKLTNNLVDASGFEGISPLIAGGEGRVWWSADNRFRLEVQGSSGDVQVVVSDRDFWVYDGATNTVYRGTLPAEKAHKEKAHAVPTVAQIERKLQQAMQDAAIAGPVPGVEAGQPAYSVRVSPRRDGGLLGGVALAWDAARGTPLRVGIYARGASSPALELSATDIQYGAVDAGVFAIQPPAGADVQQVDTTRNHEPRTAGAKPKLADLSFRLAAPDALAGKQRTKVRPARLGDQAGAVVVYGRGLDSIVVVQKPYVPEPPKAGNNGRHGHGQVDLPTTDVNGAQARVLDTPLGGAIEWTRGGVTYVVAGSAPRSVLEAAARGL
jgi:outer membrane lipoprotein-sorting protein